MPGVNDNVEVLNIPTEPSVEEQIAMAVKETEQKNQQLTFQVIEMDNQIQYLKNEIKMQSDNFNKIVARMVIDFYGRE